MSRRSKRGKARGSELLREFIAQTLATPTSGNRTIQPSPLRQGVGVRPGASSNVLDDEEAEVEALPRAACVLITHDDGRVLAVSRRDDPSAFGLPGGKVDPGETPEEAAARELAEETGLTITDLNLIHTRREPGEQDYLTYVYTGKVSGQIDTDEEGIVRWVDIQTLLDGPFGDFNQVLFKKLGRL